VFHSLLRVWFDLTLKWGYAGIFGLMAIESTVFPLPSEVVIPPAAYWAEQGRFHFWGVVIAATLGSWAGSALSYWVARFARPPAHHSLRQVRARAREEVGAGRELDRSLFVGRRVLRAPAARRAPLVSLPAGAARMPFGRFSAMTLAGSFVWSTVLAWFGCQGAEPGAAACSTTPRRCRTCCRRSCCGSSPPPRRCSRSTWWSTCWVAG
jgi:membrane protein DedA with SNARE-associated domain